MVFVHLGQSEARSPNPRVQSLELRAWVLEYPGPRSQEAGAGCWESGIKSLEPGAKNQEPVARSPEIFQKLLNLGVCVKTSGTPPKKCLISNI